MNARLEALRTNVESAERTTMVENGVGYPLIVGKGISFHVPFCWKSNDTYLYHNNNKLRRKPLVELSHELETPKEVFGYTSCYKNRPKDMSASDMSRDFIDKDR